MRGGRIIRLMWASSFPRFSHFIEKVLVHYEVSVPFFTHFNANFEHFQLLHRNVKKNGVSVSHEANVHSVFVRSHYEILFPGLQLLVQNFNGFFF
jgi:hypothetical protein